MNVFHISQGLAQVIVNYSRLLRKSQIQFQDFQGFILPIFVANLKQTNLIGLLPAFMFTVFHYFMCTI